MPAEVVEVEFLALIEHGRRFFTRKGVEFAFGERLAGVWEDDGPSSHAAVVSLEDLEREFPKHLDGPDAGWVRGLVFRALAGDDPARLREEAIAEYTSRHGRAPRAQKWQVRRGAPDQR
jgi:hypothetical protein